MADQNLDPEIIRLINENLSDLKDTLTGMVNSAAIEKMQKSFAKATEAVDKAEQEILASKGYYKDLNGKLIARSEIEERVNKQLKEQIRLQESQEDLFKKELKARGLELDETGKIVKAKKEEAENIKKLTKEQVAAIKNAESRIKLETQMTQLQQMSGKQLLDSGQSLTSFSAITDKTAETLAGPEGLSTKGKIAVEALKSLAEGIKIGRAHV